MDFRLKVFYSVATNLSFTKASHELFISQPAISKHIRELEQRFETPLFERNGNKIQLTRAGELLLSHAQSLLAAYRQLNFEMNLLTNHFSGELRLGASTTISQYVLPPLLAKFMKKFPDIKLSLLHGNSNDIERALTEGKGADGQLSIDWINDDLITFVKDRLGHDQRYAIDPSKIQRELGWLPETSFETGIVKTIRWYLENQTWVEDITGGDYMQYYERMYKGREL